VRQDQRGAANGIAMTAMSLFKAIGPAAAGIMYATSSTSFFTLNMLQHFVIKQTTRTT
jgi:hypothetical protein